MGNEERNPAYPSFDELDLLAEDGISRDVFNTPPKDIDVEDDDPTITDVSEQRAVTDFASMSFEERVDFLRKVLIRSPLRREINYKILKYCLDRHVLSEVEDFIGSCQEFKSAEQSQFYILRFLLSGGGIDVFEIDENGEVVTEGQKEGLSEDEIDDLVMTSSYETNEVGRALVEQMSPRRRLLELMEIMPEQYDTFIEVMEFLTQKRTLAQVDRALRGRAVLMAGRASDEIPLQPSVFVDRLERAGGICWNNGWLITDEGREVLETLRERRGG